MLYVQGKFKTFSCKTIDAAYEIKCTCGENDIGETECNSGKRCNEHIKKVERREHLSVFNQHMLEKQNGIEQALSIKPL